MPLKDDQTVGADEVLLGRFITAVKAIASGYLSEDPRSAVRAGLAKRVFMEKGAQNYGRVILDIAIAQNAKVIAGRSDVSDEDIIACVSQYMMTFAAEGW